MDNAAPLRWIKKSGRSKRPRPHWSDDEYDAALSLLLLSESGGGFCNSTTAEPKISPPKPNQETPPSAATRSPLIIKIKRKETASPDTLLRPPPAYACSMVHECLVCHEAFDSGQALGGHKRKKHFDKSKLARKGGGSASGSGRAALTTEAPPPDARRMLMFDLKLPPPPE
ncbi:hypothetical protein SASPL_119653 [Salvia splendens]|uniref:C2H2-type domain-containing protein n=1 Tax=Salvia splendens TaxID=180675 RepID=A0A8X8XPC9_SALSN|nr:zinc finger protein AZF2-like [Salvia splendens]KAG6417473.1 hypothetical protein SASPL_119653 [Salvia splendens]